MTHNQNIIHCHYQQLQYAEHRLIIAWLSHNVSYREIAHCLGRNGATISREIRRGKVIQIDHSHKA